MAIIHRLSQITRINHLNSLVKSLISISRRCSSSYDNAVEDRYLDLMRSVPQSGKTIIHDPSPSRLGGFLINCISHYCSHVVYLVVVVVSTALSENGSIQKRGITCSSFTSISMKPPIASFAIKMPSRMNSLLLDTDKFAIHVLARNQVKYAQHFAQPSIPDVDQFEDIPHELNGQCTPILRDTCGVLLCNTHSVHRIGDHNVWYGQVYHAYRNGQIMEPMLYYHRSFRSIGDETFIQAFEDTTLPFEDWTHEAHIRMAWNYIREKGPTDAVTYIKSGIKKYNEQNKDKINRGYHETVTMFYINVVAEAFAKCPEPDTFEEFLAKNKYLLRRNLLFDYYSDETINRKEAKIKYIPPDMKSFSDRID